MELHTLQAAVLCIIASGAGGSAAALRGGPPQQAVAVRLRGLSMHEACVQQQNPAHSQTISLCRSSCASCGVDTHACVPDLSSDRRRRSLVQ